MTQEKFKGAHLSLNVRKMKFMQRCLSEDARRELDNSDRKVITSEHWEVDIPLLGHADRRFETLDSLVHWQPCRFGRMSFGGFNKTIEKLMLEMNKFLYDDSDDDDVKSDVSISDNEMAERYASLVGTVGNKYKKLDTKSKKRRKRGVQARDEPAVPSKVKRKGFDASNNV